MKNEKSSIDCAFFRSIQSMFFVKYLNNLNLVSVILIPINTTLPYRIRRCAVYLSLAAVLSTLYACPFSSFYKLDDEPLQPIDESLLGHWATTLTGHFNKQYPVRMTLEKYTDSLYWLVFSADMSDISPYHIAIHDSIKGTAFISDVKGRQVINYQAAGQNFLGELRYENGSLSILPFEERVTNRIVKKNADLRLMLEWHYESRLKPFYDDMFALRNMTRVK